MRSFEKKESRGKQNIFHKKLKDLIQINFKYLTSISFIIFYSCLINVYSQYSSSYYATSPANSFSNSKVFRQEVARFEVTVSRDGKPPLSLTQVPRVEKDDILRVRLLEEPVGGTKPDQSNYDWTLTVAFVNPNRNDSDPRSVTEEIRFREKGWYKEHLFKVPYDSQPIIFLYTKPKYRNKIVNLINKNPEDIRRLGEKTIEIAGAYAQISSFLNELQGVLLRTQYAYDNYGSSYTNNSYYNSYSGYGNLPSQYIPGINKNIYAEQTVERLAKSFNIQLPQCWRSNNSYGNYSSYGSSSSYGSYNSYGNYGYPPQDLVGRVQCIAQNVRVEDLDISLNKMIQQGGVFVATQLAQKYPQIAYWINLAAAAMDLIVKITRKAALKIVPTVVAASDSNSQPGNQSGYTATSSSQGNYQNNSITRISVYAESQPGDDKFVTAFPVIVHKWQPEPDPEMMTLSAPALLEPCLHPGQNILKSTDLSQDWLNDSFSRNFKLVMSSPNGFFKEFSLRKNAGLMGWDLNLTREDLAAFPKIGLAIDAEIRGTRGFTELKSPKFQIPIASTAKWEVTPESRKNFTVGGKRRVVISNMTGNCLCLQSVVYKPSFGGQFVFEANAGEKGLQFSADGKEAWFLIDTTEFKSGQGFLEVTPYGGEKAVIQLKSYPQLPQITEVKVSKGDQEAVLKGERLEQVQFVNINGYRAKIIPGSSPDERVAVFENSGIKQTSDKVSLELILDEDRRYEYPETFRTSISRPAIASTEEREIDGDYIIGKASNPGLTLIKQQVNLIGLPVIPINATEISVHTQNIRTDYDFKAENLEIEARIEKGEMNLKDLIATHFEVLGWKDLRINFELGEPIQKLIGGRRLQFRIKDKTRGNSDWYTVKQTFVRVPQITQVVCPNSPKRNCELRGEGLDYIAQVSVDGGRSWFLAEGTGLVAKVMPDGTKTASIPYFVNKQQLQITLKDFSKTVGLTVSNYNYVKASK